MDDKIVERFLALFRSNGTSYGRYPRSGKPSTNTAQYELSHARDHLAGKMGLGLVPITESNECYWGAIDIDCHGEDEEIDIAAVYEKAQANALPVSVCRSKSGGVHVYVFMSEPVEAKTMRAVLRSYAEKIGYLNSEIFPKQATVTDREGKSRLGNWINLPYFDHENTNRWCFLGKQVSLEFFLDHAESTRVSAKEFSDGATGDHSEAPPCVQQMIYGKLPKGYRNEGMFAISTYMKKAYPEDWKHRIKDVNSISLEEPLQSRELETIIGSVGRRDYKYRCKESPCRDFCSAKICLTRKFGIEESESPKHDEEAGVRDLAIESITKVETDPPVYFVDVNGVRIKVNAGTLTSPAAMHVAVVEQANMVTFPIKPKDYMLMLAAAMKSMVIEKAPDEASPSGLVRTRLAAFAARASEEREHVLHNNPVKVKEDEDTVVYFKAEAFIDYLRKTKSSDLRLGPDLWAALRAAGVTTGRFRANAKKVVNVWRMVLPADDTPEYQDHSFRSEM